MWKTLKAFGADKKRLNGKLGMTAVLHTWGQTLGQHVHLHCLVPGGVLGEDRQWHQSKGNYLFPVKALSRHYRGNLVSALRCSASEGKLNRVTHKGEVDKMLDALMQKDWVVYSKHCLNHTDSIIDYLARYTHRIAISNRRLINIDKGKVHFRYKDYRDNRSKIMGLVFCLLFTFDPAAEEDRVLLCPCRRHRQQCIRNRSVIGSGQIKGASERLGQSGSYTIYYYYVAHMPSSDLFH